MKQSINLCFLYGYTAHTGLPQHIRTLGRLIVRIVAASLTLPIVAKYLELKLSVPSFMSKIASVILKVVFVNSYFTQNISASYEKGAKQGVFGCYFQAK